MASPQCWRLFLTWTWMLVFFFPSVCSSMDAPRMTLQSTVFVAFAGKDLNIDCELQKPANQTEDELRCFDPLTRPIYHCPIPGGTNPETLHLRLELKSLTLSGEYYCRYKAANVSWFLRVGEPFKKPAMFYDTEFITVTVFTAVLLVFSVVGSVYVFRGHWKERISNCGDADRKQKQNRKERKETERSADNVDAVTDQSTSFYASLDPRARSIYDVLDHSAANRAADQKKKPKEKELQILEEQTAGRQDEGVFECVYENF